MSHININLLIDNAFKSLNENKLSAILLQNNKIISKPKYNNFCNSSKHKLFTVHAEVSAIQEYYKNKLYYSPYMNSIILNKKIPRLDILVVRINKKGELLNAKPCKQCIEFMKNVKIRNVYYSTPNGIIKESIKQIINTHVTSGWRKCGAHNNL